MTLAVPAGPRLVALSDRPAMLRGVTVTSPPPSWPTKDPSDFLTYAADFASLLPSGAFITDLRVTVASGALTIGAIDKAGTVALLELGGGADGIVATVAIKVLASTGEVIVRSVTLPVVAQPGTALLPDFGPAVAAGSFRLTDPLTGLTLLDPLTNQPLTMPALPGSRLAVIDPVSGQVMLDPKTNLPLTVALA